VTLERVHYLHDLQMAKRERAAAGSHIWWDDPIRFIGDVVTFPDLPDGTPGSLADYQADELKQLAIHKRVAVRGPRGCGKTMPATLAFWWFACTRELAGVDWKIPTTAGAWPQIKLYLWPEIWKWRNLIDWQKVGLDKPRIGVELLTHELKWEHGGAFGRATNDPDLIEGAHASNMLVIIDEGKSVADGVWDAVEGFFANPGDHYCFALSTPGAATGRFHEIHTRKPGYEDWYPIHVTLAEALDAGRVPHKWAADRLAQWGEKSQVYRCHVLGEFAGEQDGVIPMAWVEAAIERGRDIDIAACRPYRIGVDVADTGTDQTVFAYIDHNTVYRLEKIGSGDVVDHADKLATRTVKGTRVMIDSIGVGAGTLAAANKLDLNATGFVASAGTKRRDATGTFGFANCVTGDTRITPIGDLRRIYRMRYDGPLYRIKMASGDEFTVTPNHNVFTLSGWVPVHTLNIGDKLADTSISDTPVGPQIGDMPPTIGEVYSSTQQPTSPIGVVVSSRERVDGRSVDFHGDRPVGDVDVVTLHRDLDTVHPSFRESNDDVRLIRFLMATGAFPRLGCTRQNLDVVWDKLRRSERHVPLTWAHSCTQVCGRCLSSKQPVRFGVSSERHISSRQVLGNTPFISSVGFGEPFDGFPTLVSVDELTDVAHIFGYQQVDTLAFSPERYTTFAQYTANHVPVDTEPSRCGMDGFTGEISVDEVVSIEVVSSDHNDPFVYTMETSTGVYRTDSVAHRNCRAAAWWNLRERLDPDLGDDISLPDDAELLGDLTAPTWREAAGGKIVIESKDDIRKRLGRSTDVGDAVVMGMWQEVGVSIGSDWVGNIEV